MKRWLCYVGLHTWEYVSLFNDFTVIERCECGAVQHRPARYRP